MGQRQDWTIIQKLGDVILSKIGGCIFEVGIGKSTLILKQFADDFKRDHYCLDKNERKCTWAKGIGCKVILGETKNTLDSFPEILVAMGLIDGRHDSITVRLEMNFFLNLLTPGGVIFMHDTYLQTDAKIRDESHPRGLAGDVYKVRQELEKRKDVQTFTWPYTAMNQGLTMVMKRELNRPYYRK